ncbi:hypothetical protein ANCCAN_26008, partial [Ancylostoma caninum]
IEYISIILHNCRRSSLDYGKLVRKAIKNWSPKLEKMTGSQKFGCNLKTKKEKTTLACRIVPM